MGAESGDGREVRAARNQAIFRAVNEQMAELTSLVGAAAEVRTIACECANVECVDSVEIAPGEYEAVRREPRRFVVRPGHLFPDVERVVSENDRFVVVEKVGLAGEVAQSDAQRVIPRKGRL
jgi:hypothetical protein